MEYTYKYSPNSIKKSAFNNKKSWSCRDYVVLQEVEHKIKLKDIVDWEVGKSLLREDFITGDVCNKYKFIKTGNISPYRAIIDFSSTQYCKPKNAPTLAKEDIIIAKDGGANGLGEVCIYYNEDNSTDYFCAEILRIRIKQNYNKWFIFAVLKSKYFKEYLDIVTPGGSTLRHSKLLALDFDIPYPINTNSEEIAYIGLLMQNLVNKERVMKKKINQVNLILESEIRSHQKVKITNNRSYTKAEEVRKIKRFDTGVYTKGHSETEELIKQYIHGYFYLDRKKISPGATPRDYKYSDKKLPNTYLWITPKNIETLELLYPTYINTKQGTNISDYNIVLSGIRYLGYGYFIDKGETVYSNQNTLIIRQSSDKNEQIYLLAFLTSDIGKKMQMSWRVDGMIPIIYKDDLAQIPIPNLDKQIKDQIVELYYNISEFEIECNRDNYLLLNEKRNESLGIYQLNQEILFLQERIEILIKKLILDESIKQDFLLN